MQTPTPVLTSIAINAPAQSVITGQTLQLSAAPKDQSSNAFIATVRWASSVPAVANVSGTGLVTAFTAGTATITAQAVAGGVTVSSTRLVTVTSVSYPATANVTENTSDAFAPSSVDIARNGSVNFIFQSTAHNVTFDVHPGAPSNVGDTYNATVSVTFNTAGSFGYQCTIHPGMTGTVVVR
jgi:plastocyanin